MADLAGISCWNRSHRKAVVPRLGRRCLSLDSSSSIGLFHQSHFDWTQLQVHTRPTPTDGAAPLAGLIQDTDGNFCGTTISGGDCASTPNCYGTVFSLRVGLGPFVEALTYSGNVGNTIEFLGQGFTSSTTVSFNGTSATLSVKSGTYLTAAVPSGATTGFVTITTSIGSSKSNKIFRVTPQIKSFAPTSGPVGTDAAITGERQSGATSVTFGGVRATHFTVDSYTEITATVPTGAKTGKIGVTTPGGTATSTGTFTLIDA